MIIEPCRNTSKTRSQKDRHAEVGIYEKEPRRRELKEDWHDRASML